MNKLFLLNPPFKTLSEVSVLADGFKLNCPFVIRNSTEFNVNIKQFKESFIKEDQILSWYETKEEIFTEKLQNSDLVERINEGFDKKRKNIVEEEREDENE